MGRASKLLHTVFVSFGAVLAALGLLLLFLLTLLFLPYRLLVRLVARVTRPDLHGFITGLTSVFMLDSIKKPTLNLLSCKILDGEVSLEQFRSLVQTRVISKKNDKGESVYFRLKQTYISFMGYAFWQWDSNFSIENHVRLYDYTFGNNNKEEIPNEYWTEEDIRRIMGDLLAAPWKESRSPWEFLLIYDYRDSENKAEAGSGADGRRRKTVFLSRFHHGIGDGHSSSQLLQDMGLNYKPAAMPSYPKLGLGMKILFLSTYPFKLCWDLADNFIRSLDFDNAWRRPRTKLCKSYYTSFTKPIPVSMIKEIKLKHRVGYLAVLYAATSGGIRRVMLEAGQEVPRHLACFNPVPKPKHPGGMVNHMMWIFTLLPIREPSVVTRLQEIQKDLCSLRNSLTPAASDLIVSMFGLLPKKMRRAIQLLTNSTLMASNFPVPPQTPVFEGCPVQDVIFGCGTGETTCGTNIFMIGLGGNQRIVVNIDKNVFPSEEIFKKLGSYIEEDLQTLLSGTAQADINAINNV